MKKNEEPTLTDVMDVLGTMTDWMGNTDARLTTIERRMGSMETILEEVRDDVQSTAKAVDKDSVTLIDHGRRIAKLERA